MWLMECENPKTNFFSSAFYRTLFSTAFWGMFCIYVAASGNVILLIIINSGKQAQDPQGSHNTIVSSVE